MVLISRDTSPWPRWISEVIIWFFILGVPGGEDYKNSLSYDDDDNCSIDDGCSLYTTDSLMTNTLSSYNKELHGE